MEFPRGALCDRRAVNSLSLFSKVAKEIWVCEKQTVTKWSGDILSYKETLKKNILKEEKSSKKEGGKNGSQAKTGTSKKGKK